MVDNTAPSATEKAAEQRRPVICLGDSHTRGFYGASWLRLLHPQFPKLRLINAGNDGEPSETIAARLPALLQAHPNPAAVIIFAGSNDCIAQESQPLQAYYKWQFRLTQPCSEQYALDNVEGMLQLVQEQAPDAKVVVINLPIMVEDPQHAANIRAHKYSTALSQLVTTKYPTVSMVDYQSACRNHMAQHSTAWRSSLQDMQQKRQNGIQITADSTALAPAPAAASSVASAEAADTAKDSSRADQAGRPTWAMTKYSLAGNMAWAKYYQSMLLGKSWNDISQQQGLVLLTDQIHINETAATILADLVQPLLLDV